MADLQFVILHKRQAYHYQRFTLFWGSILKVRKISARWLPYLLTDKQKRQRVKVAKRLLQVFQKYDKKQFANGVRVMKLGSIILSPSERLAIGSWSLNTAIINTPNNCKTVFECKEAISFSGERDAIKVLVKKGKRHHRKVPQRDSTE